MQMMTIYFKGGADLVLMGDEDDLLSVKNLLESRMGDGAQPRAEIVEGRAIGVMVNSSQIDRIKFLPAG